MLWAEVGHRLAGNFVSLGESTPSVSTLKITALPLTQLESLRGRVLAPLGCESWCGDSVWHNEGITCVWGYQGTIYELVIATCAGIGDSNRGVDKLDMQDNRLNGPKNPLPLGDYFDPPVAPVEGSL